MNDLLNNLLFSNSASLILSRYLHKTFFHNHLVITGYHSVLPSPFNFRDWCVIDLALFRKQLLYLRKHFDLLPFSEAVEKCLQGKLNKTAAVITFDDGYQNNYDIAFPLLKELNIPATIFLTTGFINTAKTHWSCRINETLAKTKYKEISWKKCTYRLDTAKDKTVASLSIRNDLKQLTHRKIESEVKQVIEILGEKPTLYTDKHSPFRMLDIQSIKKMQQSGLITFGAHTHSHPILNLLNRTDQFKQISRSLKNVEEFTGERCKIFSYPNGRKEDYSKETVELLKQCGVKLAVTTIDAHNHRSTPPLELRRIVVGGYWKMRKFMKAVHPNPAFRS